MRAPLSRLPTLVELTYAAALDPGGWTPLLTELCNTLDSKTAALVTYGFATGAAQLHVAVGADPAMLPLYEHYSPKNPLMPAIARLARTGFVGASIEVMADAELKKTEYFNDYMARVDYHHNLGLCLARDGDTATMIYPVRGIGRPPFSASDLELCRALMPHLSRALLIHRRLADAALRQSAATAALDQLMLGVFVLDRQGRALFTNDSARRIVDERDGLRLERQGLVTARSSDGTRLRHAIAAASGIAVNDQGPTGQALRIGRPSLRRDLEVLVVPLKGEAPFVLDVAAPAAVVFVADPERKVEAWDALLIRLYALTAAEARTAVLLLKGCRVQEIAEQLAVDVNTTRTHLKRIFSKTGARTQSDLVRLLLSGPAQLRNAFPGL